MDPEDLEGIAAWFHEVGKLVAPIDAFDLVDRLRLTLERVPGSRNWREPGRLSISARASGSLLQAAIAHECAHELLDRLGLENDDASAWYLAAALLIPRAELVRALRAGADLLTLMGEHVNAPAEMIARRVTEVRNVSLGVYDGGRFRYRAGVATPSASECAAARAALERREPVRVDTAAAWPGLDGRARRVLVLSEPDEGRDYWLDVQCDI